MNNMTGFAMNSSEDYYICVRVKSKKFRELLEKYNVPLWEASTEYDVVFEMDNEGFWGIEVDNVQSLLDYCVENVLFEMLSYENEAFYNEYYKRKKELSASVTKASYEASNGGVDEYDSKDGEPYQFSFDSSNKARAVVALTKEDINSSLKKKRIKVTIPEGTESIPEKAFAECRNIVEVIIPDGVKSIGKGAFYNCISLTYVQMPDSVSTIGDWAFLNEFEDRYRPSLKCRIPSSVTEGQYAYIRAIEEPIIEKDGVQIKGQRIMGCAKGSREKAVFIPEGIKAINDKAFRSKKSLRQVILPDSIKLIGEEAFRDCEKLERINLPNSISHIGIDADKIVMRQTVQASLDRLLSQNYIARNGDTYTFLTDDEQDIAREIRNTTVDSANITQSIAQIIFSDLYVAKKFRYEKYDFPFDQIVDETVIGTPCGGIKLRVVTIASDLYGSGEQALIMKSASDNEAIVLLSDQYPYFEEIENSMKIRKYVKSRNVAQLPETIQSIIRGRQQQASAYEKRAKEFITQAILNATFYADGEVITIKAGGVKEKFDTVLSSLV